jgi:iron complex outermembrane receptor protein
VSASYALIDATFQSAITLSSPNNPFADANGNIQVVPGDHLPGIPQNRFKLAVDYAVSDKWTLGGNLAVASGQYFFGDASNQNPKLGGYWTMNLHSTYHVTDNVELFALVQNVTNKRYSTFGIFGDASAIPLPGVGTATDPRFVSVAAPIAAFGGMRVRF